MSNARGRIAQQMPIASGRNRSTGSRRRFSIADLPGGRRYQGWLCATAEMGR
jgi:hypothetical protein